MSCGKRFLLLRTAGLRIWAIGCNDHNCFNQAEVIHFIVPNMIFQDVLDVSCGWAHVILLDKGRTIRTFGRNNLGQLGKEEVEPLVLQLQEGEYVKTVNSGTEFGFALTSLGRVFAWGWN
jgi:alpha-tubulin suppressor-like RCC1 family protein